MVNIVRISYHSTKIYERGCTKLASDASKLKDRKSCLKQTKDSWIQTIAQATSETSEVCYNGTKIESRKVVSRSFSVAEGEFAQVKFKSQSKNKFNSESLDQQ